MRSSEAYSMHLCAVLSVLSRAPKDLTHLASLTVFTVARHESFVRSHPLCLRFFFFFFLNSQDLVCFVGKVVLGILRYFITCDALSHAHLAYDHGTSKFINVVGCVESH